MSGDPRDRNPRDELLTVSELTERIKSSLETLYPSVWVCGEISNLSRPRSGHCYLSLKDEGAQLPGVIWRSTASRLAFELENGLEVICQGGLDVYAPHGAYKLMIRRIEPKGVGALQLAFRQLHARLDAEGLFDPALKRPLPAFPRRIGLITSPTGAAVHDFVETVRNRWPAASILIIPARVQGEGAAEEIAAAIELANLLQPGLDVLVAGRGGGSQEDLWCFNEEPVVRAIFNSTLPVVSAVGHEIDVTLADLAADVRALTPTDAANRVVPSRTEWQSRWEQFNLRLRRGLQMHAQRARQELDRLAEHRALRRPLEFIREREMRLEDLESRLHRSTVRRAESARQSADLLAARLAALSPLTVLARGYAIVHRPGDKQSIQDSSQLAPGDRIRCRFQKGCADATIDQIGPDDVD